MTTSNNVERFEYLSTVIIPESNNLLFIHMASVVISELAMMYDCHSAWVLFLVCGLWLQDCKAKSKTYDERV